LLDKVASILADRPKEGRLMIDHASRLALYTTDKRPNESGRGSLENPFAGTGAGGGQKRPE